MDAPLNMVVVKGISRKPMMLLTSLEIRPGEKTYGLLSRLR
jgi:hypothetical protein